MKRAFQPLTLFEYVTNASGVRSTGVAVTTDCVTSGAMTLSEVDECASMGWDGGRSLAGDGVLRGAWKDAIASQTSPGMCSRAWDHVDDNRHCLRVNSVSPDMSHSRVLHRQASIISPPSPTTYIVWISRLFPVSLWWVGVNRHDDVIPPTSARDNLPAIDRSVNEVTASQADVILCADDKDNLKWRHLRRGRINSTSPTQGGNWNWGVFACSGRTIVRQFKGSDKKSQLWIRVKESHVATAVASSLNWLQNRLGLKWKTSHLTLDRQIYQRNVQHYLLISSDIEL